MLTLIPHLLKVNFYFSFFEILEKLIISYHFHPIKLTIKNWWPHPNLRHEIRLSSRVLDPWLWASGSAFHSHVSLSRVSFPSDRQRSHTQLFYYAWYLPVQRSPTHVIHITRFSNAGRRASMLCHLPMWGPLPIERSPRVHISLLHTKHDATLGRTHAAPTHQPNPLKRPTKSLWSSIDES